MLRTFCPLHVLEDLCYDRANLVASLCQSFSHLRLDDGIVQAKGERFVAQTIHFWFQVDTLTKLRQDRLERPIGRHLLGKVFHSLVETLTSRLQRLNEQFILATKVIMYQPLCSLGFA